jgi:dephospho-CoA kinase
MQRRLAALDAPYCILAIPLLIETRQTHMVDRVLVIDSSEASQRQRLAGRAGWTTAEVEGALRAQIGRDERLEYADDVIDNDADLATLERAVERLHRRYQKIAGHFTGSPPAKA